MFFEQPAKAVTLIAKNNILKMAFHELKFLFYRQKYQPCNVVLYLMWFYESHFHNILYKLNNFYIQKLHNLTTIWTPWIWKRNRNRFNSWKGKISFTFFTFWRWKIFSYWFRIFNTKIITIRIGSVKFSLINIAVTTKTMWSAI